MWLPDVELAIARVAERVRSGGHLVPEEVIRRRYKSGLKNFFSLYRPLANTREVYMNTRFRKAVRIGSGMEMEPKEIDDVEMWNELLKVAPHD